MGSTRSYFETCRLFTYVNINKKKYTYVGRYIPTYFPTENTETFAFCGKVPIYLIWIGR